MAEEQGIPADAAVVLIVMDGSVDEDIGRSGSSAMTSRESGKPGTADEDLFVVLLPSPIEVGVLINMVAPILDMASIRIPLAGTKDRNPIEGHSLSRLLRQ